MSDDRIIEKYVFHAVGSNSCEKCMKHDGKEYKNANDIPTLPIHPNCKCYVEPIYKEKIDNSGLIREIDDLLSNAENLRSNMFSLEDDIESKIYEYNNINNNDVKRVLNDIASLINPLRAVSNTVVSFIENLEELRAANDASVDKYHHAKANCEAAQNGVVGSATARVLSDAKEAYDEICGTLKQKSSVLNNIVDKLDICRSNGADPEDQIANEYGRKQGRKYPDISCHDLVKDVDKLFD
jgi:hypothetical protein